MIGVALAASALAFSSPTSTKPSPPSAVTHQDTIETLAIDGFPHATLYRLPTSGKRKRPVIVILAGAEGGDEASKRFGPLLAKLGYAAIGLPYYSPDWGNFGPPQPLRGLAGSFIDIPVDQLARLRSTVARIDGVDIERFALFSGSKGSEFALIAASRYTWIDAVVAYTPSDLVWEGWGLEMLEAEGTRSSFSFEGKALAFMPYVGFVEGLSMGPKADLLAIHENGRSKFASREAAARIPVENFRGKLMLVAGGQDKLWNSARMARNIDQARKDRGLKTMTLIYPDAGHDLAGGSTEPRDDPRGGGTPAANAKARADAWPRVVTFLKRALRS